MPFQHRKPISESGRHFLIEEVLVHKAKQFRKHYAVRMNKLLLGKGLLTSDGDFWLRQRRLAQQGSQQERGESQHGASFPCLQSRPAAWRFAPAEASRPQGL